MSKTELKLQLSVVTFIIFVLGWLGCIVLTGCTINQGQNPDNNQTVKNYKISVNQEPTATSTSRTSEPPPSVPWKTLTYQEMHKSFSSRLMKKIREKEVEIALQPLENLPESVSEIRLWYFPTQEKMRGIVFSRSDEIKPIILVNEDSKEEVVIDKEKFDRLMNILMQSNIEKLKDTRSIEFTPSTGDSYLVYQIKSGNKVLSKFYPAGIGTNVEQTAPDDLCNAVELCRKISELLSLEFDDCKCSSSK